MTKEQKEPLLKDLCSRLPYGVKAYVKHWSKLDRKYYEGICTIESVHPSLNDIYASTENGSVGVILGHTDYIIKPYLFPMSSMTEEQEIEYDATFETIVYEDGRKDSVMTYKSFDWLNAHHFDYRSLILNGLAIDATNKNIY